MMKKRLYLFFNAKKTKDPFLFIFLFVMPGPEVQSLPEALKCIICTDLYSDPCVFDCGHCFCGYCGCEWLKSSKTCPKCRAPVIRRPTPVYSLQDIVDAYKRSIGEQVVVYNDKVNWTELYPENKTSYIQDNEDMVRRCVQCSWELDEFNKCEKCDIKYTVVDDEETYLTDEDEEEEEEEEDLHGFVVDDDVIEYSDATDHGESEEAVDLDDGEEVWEDDEDEGDESGLDGTCGRDEEGNDEEGMFGGVCAYDIGELPYSDEDTGHSDYGDHNEEIDLSEDIDHSDQDDIDPSDQGDIYHSDQGDIHSVHGDIHSVHGDIVLGDMDQSDEGDYCQMTT
ncbi:hypothetical protein BDB01DRAFT_788509 [Pilobolus umbonatus]|nr:hypothetical protein BDB01DRAFT_788509 [Pilobolus umbonatus]